jgi:hypothetical protein
MTNCCEVALHSRKNELNIQQRGNLKSLACLKILIPQKAENALTNCETVSFQE